MVLNGEENETLRVFLKEGLIKLLSLCSDNSLCLLLGLLDNLGLELCGIDVLVGLVLLVGYTEVELLDGRFHVKVLDTGSSLFSQLVSDQLSSNVECARSHTCFEGVICAAIMWYMCESEREK
jgi:hypothetical protein